MAVLVEMRKKLEEKLEHLYEFNYTSSNNYSTALQLAASIATGLAEVQSGIGNGKWSSSLQEELKNIVSDFEKAGFSKETIRGTLEQQYRMLDKLKVKYERIEY